MDQIYLLVMREANYPTSRPTTIRAYEDLGAAEAEAARMNQEFGPKAEYYTYAMGYEKSRVLTAETKIPGVYAATTEHIRVTQKSDTEYHFSFLARAIKPPVKLLKLSEVKTPGWYLCFQLDEPIEKIDNFEKLDTLITGHPFSDPTCTSIVELDGEGVWRSSTGHGITLEQPNYFGEDGESWFVGPITL